MVAEYKINVDEINWTDISKWCEKQVTESLTTVTKSHHTLESINLYNGKIYNPSERQCYISLDNNYSVCCLRWVAGVSSEIYLHSPVMSRNCRKITFRSSSSVSASFHFIHHPPHWAIHEIGEGLLYTYELQWWPRVELIFSYGLLTWPSYALRFCILLSSLLEPYNPLHMLYCKLLQMAAEE